MNDCISQKVKGEIIAFPPVNAMIPISHSDTLSISIRYRKTAYVTSTCLGNSFSGFWKVCLR